MWGGDAAIPSASRAHAAPLSQGRHPVPFGTGSPAVIALQPEVLEGREQSGAALPAAGLRKGGGSTSRAHHQLRRFNSRTGLTSVGPDVCPKGQTQERAEGMGQDAVVFVPPLAAAPGKVCCSSGGVGGQRLPTYSR